MRRDMMSWLDMAGLDTLVDSLTVRSCRRVDKTLVGRGKEVVRPLNNLEIILLGASKVQDKPG